MGVQRFCGATYYLDDSGVATAVEEPVAHPASEHPITPSPGGTPPTYPDDMPEPGALALDSGPEGEGASSGTLTVQPSFALPEVLRFRTTHHEADAGYTEARSLQVTTRRAYDCAWKALTQADYQLVRDLFAASAATTRVLPFAWTPPGMSAGKWAVHKGARYEPLKGGAAPWRIRALLVECR